MSERKVCTAESPYENQKGEMWVHPSAMIVDGSCDCCEEYHCLICGLYFKNELPE